MSQGTPSRVGRAWLLALVCLWTTATGFAAPAPDTGTPRGKAEAFFETIIQGDAKALDKLLTGSGFVATRPNAPYSLRSQLQSSFATYGKPLGYDLVEEKNFGASLTRLVYILRLEKTPLTWEFFFYDNGTTLSPIDVHFNDRLDVYRYDRVPSVSSSGGGSAN